MTKAKKAKQKARAERVRARVSALKKKNKQKGESNRVRRLVEQGYTYDEIVDELEDLGYDSEDIDEALIDTGYDWREALVDAIHDQTIDLHDAEYYADLLAIHESEVYDIYFDYAIED